MLALLVAASLAPPPAPAQRPAQDAPPRVRVADDRLECRSGGAQTATILAIPPGVTRISGTARRTVGRLGGYRVGGTRGGFALRIGVAGPTDRTVAGFFARSGPGSPGPPRVADKFDVHFGRYRQDRPFEFAGPAGPLQRYAITDITPLRFEIAIDADGAVGLHMAWTDGDRPREAGGVVPADGRPTRLIFQCEVDDFVIEDIALR
jgi:hypothetical protein